MKLFRVFIVDFSGRDQIDPVVWNESQNRLIVSIQHLMNGSGRIPLISAEVNDQRDHGVQSVRLIEAGQEFCIRFRSVFILPVLPSLTVLYNQSGALSREISTISEYLDSN